MHTLCSFTDCKNLNSFHATCPRSSQRNYPSHMLALPRLVLLLQKHQCHRSTHTMDDKCYRHFVVSFVRFFHQNFQIQKPLLVLICNAIWDFQFFVSRKSCHTIRTHLVLSCHCAGGKRNRKTETNSEYFRFSMCCC